jgi:hypothetical protein
LDRSAGLGRQIGKSEGRHGSYMRKPNEGAERVKAKRSRAKKTEQVERERKLRIRCDRVEFESPFLGLRVQVDVGQQLVKGIKGYSNSNVLAVISSGFL